MAIEPLVQRLIAIQLAEALSDTAFARRLGIHRVMWSLVRRGLRRGGRKFLDGAFREYPELSFVHAQAVQNDTAARPHSHIPAREVA